jgi:hypothetical protein
MVIKQIISYKNIFLSEEHSRLLSVLAVACHRSRGRTLPLVVDGGVSGSQLTGNGTAA